MELNADTLFILGRPNFWCYAIAQRMRERGHVIPNKAEDEQAHVIHLMLEYYEKFGSGWRVEIDKYLNLKSA